ncbi:hypothetical protein Unana1_06153 [Umbelopsis nana]
MAAANTPVSDAIHSLQSQIEELKAIAAEYQSENNSTRVDTAPSAASDPSLLKELEELRVKYAKANYRIEFLCRALDEKNKLLKASR